MPSKHPIVAVTGSHGAGLSTVRRAFKTVFRRLGIKAAIVHGDASRRYTEPQFEAALAEARANGRHLSWFGPECNHFAELEAFFKSYSETGSGMTREYAHDPERAAELGVPVGEFTPCSRCRAAAISCSTRVSTAGWWRRPERGARWIRGTSRTASTGGSTPAASMLPSTSIC